MNLVKCLCKKKDSPNKPFLNLTSIGTKRLNLPLYLKLGILSLLFNKLLLFKEFRDVVLNVYSKIPRNGLSLVNCQSKTPFKLDVKKHRLTKLIWSKLQNCKNPTLLKWFDRGCDHQGVNFI